MLVGDPSSSFDETLYPLRPLTSMVGWELAPSWSPDGSLLAYSHAREGDMDVFVRPTEGGDPIRLTDMPCDEHSPRWSPDGQLIAFVADPGDGAKVYLTSPLGGPLQELVKTGLPAVEHMGEARASLGANPWSPNGRELIFSREADAGGVALWRIDRISKEETQITFPEAEERHLARISDLTPDP